MTDLARQLQWCDATETADLIRAGQISATESVDAAIARIEALNPSIAAVNIEWFDAGRADAARADARRAARGGPSGPFDGVPTLIKDLWAHVDGQPLSNGNAALAGVLPRSTLDTNMVARIRASGLVSLGRTTSPEFGSVAVTEPVAWPSVHNPWALARSPGGSSGGAAAAVAAGMVPVAHASDGGGSIRIPASMCGLVGLKPSQGRCSLGPLRAETVLGVELCVSRSVRDTARFLDAVHGPGVGDFVIAPAPTRPYVDSIATPPPPLRIGVLDHHPRNAALHPDCVAAVDHAASVLAGVGHRLEASWPTELEADRLGAVFAAIWSSAMAVSIADLEATLGRPTAPDEVESMNRAQADLARSHTAVDYAAALGTLNTVRRNLHQWWADGFDLLLTPTLAEPPVALGEVRNDPANPFAPLIRCSEFVPFTQPYNISGQPAISLPLWWNGDGLPIGVQLVAAYGREDLLLAVAAQVEQAAPWGHRRPPGAQMTNA